MGLKAGFIRMEIPECTKHSCLKRYMNNEWLCVHCYAGDPPNRGLVAEPARATPKRTA